MGLLISWFFIGATLQEPGEETLNYRTRQQLKEDMKRLERKRD